MYWLEDGIRMAGIFQQPNFRPTSLTITIRYSDWWYWESNSPLRMSERWLQTFKGPPGLKELRVEYETLSWKREELMRIVERNKQFRLGVVRDEDAEEEEGHLSAEKTNLVEWKWKGPSKLDGKQWTHHGHGEEVEYIVIEDMWRYVKGKLEVEESAPQLRRFMHGHHHIMAGS
jgi:hypothetical protein